VLRVVSGDLRFVLASSPALRSVSHLFVCLFRLFVCVCVVLGSGCPSLGFCVSSFPRLFCVSCCVRPPICFVLLIAIRAVIMTHQHGVCFVLLPYTFGQQSVVGFDCRRFFVCVGHVVYLRVVFAI